MLDISIIIIQYNQINFLQPLIEYLLENLATIKPITTEIIVVDNCSSGSQDWFNLYQSQYKTSIKAIFLEQNYGPSYARNRGVELSTGTYIQFIDADDWIELIKLKIQYEFASENQYPSFITSTWARVTANSYFQHKQELSLHQPSFTDPVILSVIKNDGFVPLMSGLIKKDSFVKSGGFNEEMWLVEDVRLLIDLYQTEPSFKVCFAEKPLFFYRVGQNHSLSTSKPLNFYLNCYSNVIYVKEILKNNGYILTIQDVELFVNIYAHLSRFFFEHDRAKFHEIMQKIYNLNPNYLPVNHPSLKILYRYFGYEKAEAIALFYRQLKKLVNIL